MKNCRIGVFPYVVSILCGVMVLPSASQTAVRLPADQPKQIDNVEVVCTGIGLDARQDPRWQSYPLKVEVAGREGQYLGDLSLTLLRDGTVLIKVECAGPWLLFRIPAGRYQIKVVTEGVVARAGALVRQSGQARVVLRYPTLGGEISIPATRDSN